MEYINNLNPETLKAFLNKSVDEINDINSVIAPMKAKRDQAKAKAEAAERAKAEAKKIADDKERELAEAKALLEQVAAEEKAKKETEALERAKAKAKADAIAKAKKLLADAKS